MVFAAQVTGPTIAAPRNAGVEKVQRTRRSFHAKESCGRIPSAAQCRRSASWLKKQVTAAVKANAQTAPGSRHRSAKPTVTGNVTSPRAKLIRAIVRKASNPARAPVWAPLNALKNKRTQIGR